LVSSQPYTAISSEYNEYRERIGDFFWDKDEDDKKFKILSMCRRKEDLSMYYRYVATENLVDEGDMQINEELAEYTLCSEINAAEWVSWVEPTKKVIIKKASKKRKLK